MHLCCLTASQSPSTFPLAKSSQAEIWAQAEQDLITAASLLPVTNEVIGKPTKGAAYAVLGKIYVYEENFDKAIEVLEPRQNLLIPIVWSKIFPGTLTMCMRTMRKVFSNC